MALKTKPVYSFDDYLSVEREQSEIKHEYVNGEVFAMTGAPFNRQLPSLREYALVSQDRALVEIFTRRPDGRWLLGETEGLDGDVVFELMGCQVAMREIYDKVDFEQGEPGSG